MADWITDPRWGGDWKPWRADSKFHLQDGNSCQHKWLNLATGARMMLIADGTWSNPAVARFRLWANYPGTGDVELTELLRGRALNDGRYLTDTEPGAGRYQHVEVSCVSVVENLLGLPEGITWEPWSSSTR